MDSVDAAPRIENEAQARALLAAAPQARAEIEWRAYDQQVICQGKFLLTPCANDSRHEQRESLRKVRDAEVRANAWLRAAQDAAYADKRAEQIRLADEQAAEQASERARLQQDYQVKQLEAQRKDADAATQAAQEDQRAAGEAVRRREKEAQRERSAQQLQADQAQRDENERNFARKQVEALERQAEVRQKLRERAEKEKQDQGKK
jgi:hypothetical protein